MTRPSFDNYFLGIATAVSARADCRRALCGAVIVKDNRIVATGYNGAAPGGPSCLDGECPRGLKSYEELAGAHHGAGGNNDYSDCIASHAEQNAISYARWEDLQGATIYITGAPCDSCSKLISAARITRTVYA